MASVTLGTKIFSRSTKLENLLKSVPRTNIGNVVVADDGPKSDEKRTILENNYEFDLTVLDLDYDAGLGYARKRIVDETKSDYILFVDSDHVLPSHIDTLIDQMEVMPRIGAISGSIVEPENQRIYLTGQDFYERRSVLIRDAFHKDKDVRIVAGSPFIEFDYISTVGLYRRDCLLDYNWDPEYVIGGEHLDFFVGHWKNTTWKFGACPEVIFHHYPGGDLEYMSNRESEKKLNHSRRYFLQKWGYQEFKVKNRSWIKGSGNTKTRKDPLSRARRVFREDGPVQLLQKGHLYLKRKILGDKHEW